MTNEEMMQLMTEMGHHEGGMENWVPDNAWLLVVNEAIARERVSVREKVAKWMIDRSYATGHGDTIEDLLKELEWQVREREREACAKVCEELYIENWCDAGWEMGTVDCAAAIRARGNK